MAKPDLNKLRTEIDNRKKERNIASSPLGESTGTAVAPRDAFLYELLKSHDTGAETSATKLIKLVENQVAVKNKETVRHNINETEVVDRVPARLPLPTNKPVDMSPEREGLTKETNITCLADGAENCKSIADSITDYCNKITYLCLPVSLQFYW